MYVSVPSVRFEDEEIEIVQDSAWLFLRDCDFFSPFHQLEWIANIIKGVMSVF